MQSSRRSMRFTSAGETLPCATVAPYATIGSHDKPIFAGRLDREIAVDRGFPRNRRYFARVAIDLPAQYAIEGQSRQNAIEGQPRWHSSTIVDIGGGGVRLQTVEDIANVTKLSIRFALEGTTVVAAARIVLSAFDRSCQCYVSGAAFTSIDAQSQQKIVQRVAELQARGKI